MTFDHRTYNRERARRRKADWIEENGPCRKCGSNKDLEVDHIDPSLKSFSPSFTEGKEKLLTELSKCQVLCHNCHLAKSKANGELGGGQNKIINPSHGTWAMYTNFKCRCEKCAQWLRLYRQKIVHCDGSPRPCSIMELQAPCKR
jgi:hypothetical protein